MDSLIDDISFINPQGVRTFKNLINGQWEGPADGKTFEVTNPATSEVIGLVPAGEAEAGRRAVQAAKVCTTMCTLDSLARREILHKARILLQEHVEAMAEMITREAGKPITLSRGEVNTTLERLHLTSEEVRVLYGDYLPGDWVYDTLNKFALVLRKPLGVVLAISPFNYPLFIAGAKIIPALLAGNSVVVKPASDTPISVLMFTRILELAGLPPGAINVVTGRGSLIGDTLIQHQDVDAISFTGSTPVGEGVAAKAGIKKLHLELGGKAAAIVLADANIELAARRICAGSFRNSGQRCDAVSRVLVSRKVKDRFLQVVLAEAEKYVTGDPMHPETRMGTVINAAAAKHITGLIEDAVQKGAKIVKGGSHRGLFYDATILDDVTPRMRVAREETFGPVMPILVVDNAEEAVRLSNDSEYGLDACLFTEDIHAAVAISRQLQDGSVTINDVPSHGVGHFPFGGNKKSGLGREGLKYSIDELTKLHTVIFAEEGREEVLRSKG